MYIYSASENVKKAYSLEFASKREQNKDKIADIRKQLQIREGDSGSSAVQSMIMIYESVYILTCGLCYCVTYSIVCCMHDYGYHC